VYDDLWCFTKGKKIHSKNALCLKILLHNNTADDATNKMVNDLIHNYKIKLNDLQGIT
jgi:DNA-directed RNA polymerase subunit beta